MKPQITTTALLVDKLALNGKCKLISCVWLYQFVECMQLRVILLLPMYNVEAVRAYGVAFFDPVRLLVLTIVSSVAIQVQQV